MAHGRARALDRFGASAHSNCASRFGPIFLGGRLLKGYVAFELNSEILSEMRAQRFSKHPTIR
jgi:hypothetical protein